MEFKIRQFIAVIFWTCLTVVCCSNPSDICPRRNGDTWRVDTKEGVSRCILSCSDGYVPSGCHVIRPIHGGGYNIATPVCEKAPYVSGTTAAAVGLCAGAAVVGVPYAIGVAGFQAAGVAAGSLAAFLQGSGTLGSLFAGFQSAGVAGLAASTKAVIGAVCYMPAEYVMKTFKGCEAE